MPNKSGATEEHAYVVQFTTCAMLLFGHLPILVTDDGYVKIDSNSRYMTGQMACQKLDPTQGVMLRSRTAISMYWVAMI